MMRGAPGKGRLMAWSVGFASVFLSSCSGIWGFDTLVAGDAGVDGGDGMAEVDASRDATGDTADVDGTSDAQDSQPRDTGADAATEAAGRVDGGGDSGADGASGADGSDGGGVDGSGQSDSGIPPGWTLVEVAASSGTPPACGIEWSGGSSTSYDGLQAGAATCGCACGSPASVVCSVQVTPDGQNTCTNIGSASAWVSGTCAYQSGPDDVSGPSASGGSCPAQPTVSVPSATWTRTVEACSRTTAGSMPAVDPGFSLCLENMSDVATCPAGYGNRLLEYASVTDSRGCSSCTCGSPSGVSCGGMWGSYSDSSCQTAHGTYGLPGSCLGWGPGGYSEYLASPSGGSCAASSVSATGSASPSSPVTFCCE